jgi:hypothetical protein
MLPIVEGCRDSSLAADKRMASEIPRGFKTVPVGFAYRDIFLDNSIYFAFLFLID